MTEQEERGRPRCGQERVERVEILRCPECGWHILRENGVDGQRCEAGEVDAELDCDGVCEVVSLVPAHLLDTAVEALRDARNKVLATRKPASGEGLCERCQKYGTPVGHDSCDLPGCDPAPDAEPRRWLLYWEPGMESWPKVRWGDSPRENAQGYTTVPVVEIAPLLRWLEEQAKATRDEYGNYRSGYDEGRFDAFGAVEAHIEGRDTHD